jgi:hypothetical protein
MRFVSTASMPAPRLSEHARVRLLERLRLALMGKRSETLSGRVSTKTGAGFSSTPSAVSRAPITPMADGAGQDDLSLRGNGDGNLCVGHCSSLKDVRRP